MNKTIEAIAVFAAAMLLFFTLFGCTESKTLLITNGGSGSSKFLGDCYANKFVAGVDLNAGNVVQISTSGTGIVIPSVQSTQMPVGVVYAAAKKDADVWVCVGGIVRTLFDVGQVPSAGWVAYVSSTSDGHADNADTIPNLQRHNAEIGHVIDSNTTGGSARVELHFN